MGAICNQLRLARDACVGLRSSRFATHDQIAEDNLQDLSLQAGPSLEQLLEDVDEEMAKRSADERAVNRHLGHTGREVSAVLAPVVGDP